MFHDMHGNTQFHFQGFGLPLISSKRALMNMPDSVVIDYARGYRLPINISGILHEPTKTECINGILKALGTGARAELN
jgi:hypothetical protein